MTQKEHVWQVDAVSAFESIHNYNCFVNVMQLFLFFFFFLISNANTFCRTEKVMNHLL